MNKDCHYCGTYYLARMAGFDSEEALQIAWAAETVDECHLETMKNLIEMSESMSIRREFDTCFILTILDTFDDLRHVFSVNALTENSDEQTTIALTGVRSIWMPFHFLPGNWKKTLKYNQMEYYNGTDRSFMSMDNPHQSQNMHDWGLMCRTSSETCWSMIQNAKKQYHEWKDVNNSLALNAIGIAMHVLADTWSHEFFVGSPNKLINFAEFHYNSAIVRGQSTAPLAAVSISDYTYDATGHGPAGCGPDIPYLDNRYILRHPFLDRCAEGARIKVRDNQKRFLNGFAQMLQALRYIKSPMDPETDTQSRTDILEGYEKVKGELTQVKELFNNIKVERYQTDVSSYYVFNHPDVDEGIQNWKDLIRNTYKEELVDYDLMRTGIYGVIHFMNAAKKHREAVIKFIEDKIGWRDVFSYQSPFRDAPYDADECVRRFYNIMSDGDKKIMPFYVPIRRES